jgi:hypothetical protein
VGVYGFSVHCRSCATTVRIVARSAFQTQTPVPLCIFLFGLCHLVFKLRLIIMISRSAGWLLRAVNRYHWDTRTVEFDLSRALFLY